MELTHLGSEASVSGIPGKVDIINKDKKAVQYIKQTTPNFTEMVQIYFVKKT